MERFTVVQYKEEKQNESEKDRDRIKSYNINCVIDQMNDLTVMEMYCIMCKDKEEKNLSKLFLKIT